MRSIPPNTWRIIYGQLGSSFNDGMNGAFSFPNPGKPNNPIFVVASNGIGWEHVSVTIQNTKRCPTWEEMCYVKNMFWHEDETVWQYHPPKSEYVSQHPYCLHLWKKDNFEMPLPPSIAVGIKNGS